MTRAAVLRGIGAMVPPRAVDNHELSTVYDTNDAWIRTRTGIRQRHWADPGTATGDLATVAGARALKSAGGGPVDMVVLATSTPNQPMPATAPEVAARLGLDTVPAYDLTAACAGFIYALSSAAGAIAAGFAGRVLVIGADLWSTRLDPQDRTTGILFGDGAGAAVLEAGREYDPGALMGFDLGSDGRHKDLAKVPGGGSLQLAEPNAQSWEKGHYLTMRGKEIFTHAVARMSESSQRLLKQVGWEPGDIDWFAGHQANVRILHAVADVLDVDRSRVLIHLDRVGNTSAASIPLALTDAAAHGSLRAGQRVLMTSFGGGLSWGSAALSWPDIDVDSDVM
jgi:3-oxoacyl-[acyl-carrier-protein] synthase III